MSELAEAVVAATVDLTDTEITEGPLTRRIIIRPEFDCFTKCAFDKPTCRPGAGGWHGQGSRRVILGVSMAGVGGVSIDLHTPICTEEGERRHPDHRERWSPIGALDIHHANPVGYLEEMGWSTEECAYTGGRCWSDVTFLQADKAVEVLLAGGVKVVWSWLAEEWLPSLVEAQS